MAFLYRGGMARRRGVTVIPGLSVLIDALLSSPNPQAPQHGAQIAVLRDLSGKGNHASQTETAKQPRLDLNTTPGRPSVAFQGQQHLTAPAPPERILTVYALVLVSPDATDPQILLTQDTSAATTLPAWEVQVG